MKSKKRTKKTSEPVVSQLEYESLFDEAMNMAHDLQEIEHEVKLCALCDGREDCAYSAKALLQKLGYILFKSIGYHKLDKYAMLNEVLNQKKESERHVKEEDKTGD